jgi:pilus assembly protein CpaC
LNYARKKIMATKKQNRLSRKVVLAMCAALTLNNFAYPTRVSAADDSTLTVTSSDTTSPDAATGETKNLITIEPGKAKKVSFDHRIKKANVLVPDIADVIPLGPQDLLVTGKKAGTTQIIVWDDADHTQIMDIEVSSPIANLRKTLAKMFPDSQILVEDNNGNITLTGSVHDLQTADLAAQVASPYGVKVYNLLEIAGGQQVELKVKFAEVDRQAEKQLGFNFSGIDGVSFLAQNIGKNPLGILSPGGGLPGASIAVPTAVSAALFGQGAVGGILFDYFIDALENNNLLRFLAEPTLVTTSGQQATFLAGGSFPYPVPQTGTGGGSTITIQFQDYGVNIRFTPIVLGNGRIRLRVNPEVSQLDYSNSVTLDGTSVPGLTKRTVDTTVELAQGQTFALAGLLQDSVTANNQSMPLLGDVPVLGALFRSVKYQRNQTELVVLVTPRLVDAMNPGDVTPVPGEKYEDPNRWAFYLLGDLGTDVKLDTVKVAPNAAPRFEGAYGFQPATQSSSGK